MLNTRDEYIKLIRQELLGPGSEISIPDHEHELISNAPHTRYSIGILFPHNCKMNAENDDVARSEADGDAADSEEAEIEENESAEAKNTKYKDDDYEDLKDNENLDEEISLAAQNMPSSIGMTFFARGNTDTIHCNVQFGTYRHAKAPDCKIPFHPQDPKTYVVPSELDAYIHYDAETEIVVRRCNFNLGLEDAICSVGISFLIIYQHNSNGIQITINFSAQCSNFCGSTINGVIKINIIGFIEADFNVACVRFSHKTVF